MTERQIQSAIHREWFNRLWLLLPNYTPAGWFECDLFGVSRAGYGLEFEIKVSVSDFRADRNKHGYARGHWENGSYVQEPPTTKHQKLVNGDTRGPTRFWYVTPVGLLVGETIPDWAGLIEVEDLTSKGSIYDARVSTRKDGPRIHKQPVPDAVRNHALSVCYYRYWSERNERDILQKNIAGMSVR